MLEILAVVLVAGTQPLPSLTPVEQSVLTRTRSQAATKLAPSATAKLKTISNSLANGPTLNDYAGATRRAVIAAFPGVKLSDGEVNSLSALALADTIDSLKTQMGSLSELGDAQKTRLQTAMDRHSKMMTAVSNFLKLIKDTNQGISQNLK